MGEFQKWCVENNQKFEAVVVDDDGLKKYQPDSFLREIKLSPIKLQFFNSEDQAIDWLKDFGFFKVKPINKLSLGFYRKPTNLLHL